MAKFHISPKTHKVGRCDAPAGKCPFGKDMPHFKTRTEAQKIADQTIRKTFSTVSKKVKSKSNHKVVYYDRKHIPSRG